MTKFSRMFQPEVAHKGLMFANLCIKKKNGLQSKANLYFLFFSEFYLINKKEKSNPILPFQGNYLSKKQ